MTSQNSQCPLTFKWSRRAPFVCARRAYGRRRQWSGTTARRVGRDRCELAVRVVMPGG
jgi:hypothetical protein